MTCGRTHLLEALVRQETPELEAELLAHAAQCARCRHELNWLHTERGLFRQRAAQEEVSALWADFSATLPARPAPVRTWPGLWVALAASVLAVVAVYSEAGLARLGDGFERSAALESQPLASEDAVSSGDERCSRLPQGLGFHCGPTVPASFLASR